MPEFFFLHKSSYHTQNGLNLILEEVTYSTVSFPSFQVTLSSVIRCTSKVLNLFSESLWIYLLWNSLKSLHCENEPTIVNLGENEIARFVVSFFMILLYLKIFGWTLKVNLEMISFNIQNCFVRHYIYGNHERRLSQLCHWRPQKNEDIQTKVTLKKYSLITRFHFYDAENAYTILNEKKN